MFALIFVRGGSKGVRKKNIREINGTPLLARAINLCKKSGVFAEIFVSTEDPEIKLIATEWGATVIDRPTELATDCSSELLAWKHAVKFLFSERDASEEDLFVSVPTTTPLKEVKDIVGCINDFKSNKYDLVLSGAESERSPYFNMVELNKGGTVSPVIPGRYTRRQDAPVTFDLTTVCYVTTLGYVYLTDTVMNENTGMSVIEKKNALDIDTEYDFYLAELILRDRENE